jgi:hypothetical protein
MFELPLGRRNHFRHLFSVITWYLKYFAAAAGVFANHVWVPYWLASRSSVHPITASIRITNLHPKINIPENFNCKP